jgi:hypothetical protein
MQCSTHGLAQGPDGRCVLCRRHIRAVAERRGDRRYRLVARIVVAVFAGLFTFAWLLAIFDTQSPPSKKSDAGAPGLR